MKSATKIVTGIFVFLAGVHGAHANENKNYLVASDLTWAYTKQSVYAQSIAPRLIYGRQISDLLAWEAHLLKGGSAAGLSLDYSGGGFLRFNAPVWKVDFFALAGYGVTQLSTGATTISGNSVAGGFGLQFNVLKNLGIRFDYVVYTSQETWDEKTYSYGIVYRF